MKTDPEFYFLKVEILRVEPVLRNMHITKNIYKNRS